MQATRNEVTGRWSLTGVEDSNVTFDRMCKMLQLRLPFKFARYGDGEINCMNGKVGNNCDRHKYFPDLGARLRRTLETTPEYMVGIQPLSVAHMRDSVNKYFSGIDLYNADTIHNASIDGKLNEFFETLEDRDVLLVGPPHLAGVLPEAEHVAITPVDCWKDYDNIVKNIPHDRGDLVVLLCASMVSEVIIHDYRMFKDITMIDMGSVLDPYAGVKSRRYHHKLNIA